MRSVRENFGPFHMRQYCTNKVFTVSEMQYRTEASKGHARAGSFRPEKSPGHRQPRCDQALPILFPDKCLKYH